MKTTLNRHVQSVHEGKKPFECSICNIKFARKDYLKKHVSVHGTKKKQFNCTICNVSFTEEKELQMHVESSHEIGKLYVQFVAHGEYAISDINFTKKRKNKKPNEFVNVVKKPEPVHEKKKLETIEQNESKEKSESTEQNETIEQNDSLVEGEGNKITENDVGKMNKNQCAHCFETYHKDSIKRHSSLCELYQKFTINGSECSVCLKIFESRKELNGHIGRMHKKELNELTKTKGTYLYYLNWNLDEFM